MIESDGDHLEYLAELLKKKEKELNKLIRQAKNRIGNKLLRYVKEETPVAEKDGGTAQKSWIYRETGADTGVVESNLDYIVHLEYGHRTRLGTGKGKKYRPKGDIRFVPGAFMLKKSIDNIDKEIEKEIEKVFENFWDL
ncbi:HK97 gp10 family phage protein [Metaclostridioides mangenotii]|uniref:HK97 gp10 family phage protein n=1 Tax=Metaclostridioides mangenotii TaxID=1540 RepID=UPI0026E9813A|nr:HK97 gp10 family phage protein [Clostridioides mangenotii]